jgi:hypothetical protein
MTVLPKSPVREYAERVEVRVVARLNEPGEIPVLYKHAYTDVVWREGVRHGLALAHAIVVSEEPAPGQETTRFEYRAAEVKGDVSTGLADWRPTCERAHIDLDVAAEGQSSGGLVIERRTVTVTEPVRVDADGEPVS